MSPRDKTRGKPTTSAKRRERERAEMHKRIIAVAREMFMREGYEAVTLRAVANAIEYSHAALYQYFPDKKSLIIEVCRADYEELSRVVMECVAIADPVERLFDMARKCAAWAVTHPHHYEVMMRESSQVADDLVEGRGADRWDLEGDALDFLRAAIEEAVRARRVRPKYTNVDLVVATLWASIHGVISLEIAMDPYKLQRLGPGAASFADRIEGLLNVLKEGYLQ